MTLPDTYPWMNGRLHSPHFIFLHTVQLPIPHLLRMLGYSDVPEASP